MTNSKPCLLSPSWHFFWRMVSYNLVHPPVSPSSPRDGFSSYFCSPPQAASSLRPSRGFVAKQIQPLIEDYGRGWMNMNGDPSYDAWSVAKQAVTLE